MGILGTSIDPRHPSYLDNRGAMLQRLAQVETALEAARSGGGERHVTRHHARGKLLPRERVELLVDRDSPVLELSPAAGWGTDFPVGAGVVTALGVVEGVECVVLANDPTVNGGALNPYTARKIHRAAQIALANRLPLVSLLESAGTDPAEPAETLLAAGAALHDVSRLSAVGVATVSVVFGEVTGATAYLAEGADHTVMVRSQARALLARRPETLADGTTGAEEPSGELTLPAAVTQLADFLAEDERDGLRLARQCVRRLNHRKLGPGPRTILPEPPKHDPEDLLSVVAVDPAAPFDPHELLARVLDGSEFDEFKPAAGTGLVCGWGELHGYPLAVLANARPVPTAEELRKAVQFIQLSDGADIPLLFVHHAAMSPAGAGCARDGLVQHGAELIAAIAATAVPRLTLVVGSWSGTGDLTMGGRASGPRFLFSWPSVGSAPTRATDGRGADGRSADGRSADGRGADGRDADVRSGGERPEAQCPALSRSGRLHDDGVIDPRDTRTALAVCLSAVHGNVVGRRRAGRYTADATGRHPEGPGVIRMRGQVTS